MIYITGDTHGDIDYKKLLTLKEKNLSYGDFLIICGDAGICWSHQEFQYFLNLYNDIGCTIIFVDEAWAKEAQNTRQDFLLPPIKEPP